MSAPPGVPPEVPTYAEFRQTREQGAVIGARDRAQAVSYAYRRGITGA